MNIHSVLFGFLVCLVVCPAVAQEPPISDWSDIETVVVHGEAKGPAFWHLSKDNAEVWILGTLNPLPEGLYWNEGKLKEVITGAKQVILPPEADFGFFSKMWFILTNMNTMKLPDGQKLDDVLPDDLRRRFQSVVAAMGGKAERYERYKPLMAGLMLEVDYNKANKLLSKGLDPTVEAITREAGVKTRPISEVAAIPMFKEMLKEPLATGLGCFAGALQDVETRRIHAVAAANAWASGDIAGIKAHYSDSSMKACLSKTSLTGRLEKRGVDDVMAAINDALAKPGKTVMLVDIGTLLRQGGVVDRLHAAGITVEGPAE